VRELEITSKKSLFFSFNFSKIHISLYFKIISDCREGTSVVQLSFEKPTRQETLQALHHSSSFNHDSKYKAVPSGNTPGKYKQEHFRSACSILSHHR